MFIIYGIIYVMAATWIEGDMSQDHFSLNSPLLGVFRGFHSPAVYQQLADALVPRLIGHYEAAGREIGLQLWTDADVREFEGRARRATKSVEAEFGVQDGQVVDVWLSCFVVVFLAVDGQKVFDFGAHVAH